MPVLLLDDKYWPKDSHSLQLSAVFVVIRRRQAIKVVIPLSRNMSHICDSYCAKVNPWSPFSGTLPQLHKMHGH